jgi:hypothetical protein
MEKFMGNVLLRQTAGMVDAGFLPIAFENHANQRTALPPVLSRHKPDARAFQANGYPNPNPLLPEL